MTFFKKFALSFMILLNVQFINSQTFSASDVFPTDSKTKEIETDTYFLSLRTEKKEDFYLITGEIIDKATGDPIVGASVIPMGTSSGTITDFDGKFSLESKTETPKLSIQIMGFSDETVEVPPVEEDNDAVTSLSGLLVANFGEESVIQPNIMFSQGWMLGRHAIELRILGFQKNKDTIRKTNGLNLIKPEISRYNFRLTGDIKPFKNYNFISLNPEINIYKQQLNRYDILSQDIIHNDITSFLGKITVGFKLADGLHLYASGVYFDLIEGVQFYKQRFGQDVAKEFWNFELSGKFAFDNGPLDGTFIQAGLNFNSSDYKDLLNTQDSGVFLIRLGFNKPLAKRQ